MLHKDPFIIKPATLQLIQQLQSLPELKEFYLVGGTALALQLNHRNLTFLTTKAKSIGIITIGFTRIDSHF